MSVTWDQAAFDAVYRTRIRDASHPLFGQTIGYSRLGMARAMGPYADSLDIYDARWSNLVRDFGIQPADRVLVGGCGFGFLIEVAQQAGYPNIWGIDNSQYIADHRQTEAAGDVLWVADDFTGGGRIRQQLNQLTGGRDFDWVITEDVLTSYTDAECPPIFSASETVLAGSDLSQIIHMVTEAPISDARFNAHTLEEWKALQPDHSFVSIRLSQWRVL